MADRKQPDAQSQRRNSGCGESTRAVDQKSRRGPATPVPGKCISFRQTPDALECVCSRLAENPFFKDLTASTEHEPAAGTKRKLTPSSRPICKSMPKIGAGDCSQDARHAVQVYGSAYTTPRAPSDRPVSRCTERFVLERTHHCIAAVSLTVVLSVKNNDPAFHPRAAAGIGKLELAARDDGRRGWEPELARMRSRIPRLCRPDWDMVVSLHALAWDGSGRG